MWGGSWHILYNLQNIFVRIPVSCEDGLCLRAGYVPTFQQEKLCMCKHVAVKFSWQVIDMTFTHLQHFWQYGTGSNQILNKSCYNYKWWQFWKVFHGKIAHHTHDQGNLLMLTDLRDMTCHLGTHYWPFSMYKQN